MRSMLTIESSLVTPQRRDSHLFCYASAVRMPQRIGYIVCRGVGRIAQITGRPEKSGNICRSMPRPASRDSTCRAASLPSNSTNHTRPSMNALR